MVFQPHHATSFYSNQLQFSTLNGQGDLAVMSIETFERIVGKFELCKLLNEGINDVRNNRVLSAEEV